MRMSDAHGPNSSEPSELPPWMQAAAVVLKKESLSLHRELEKQSFEIAYDTMLEDVASGGTLTDFCRRYHTPLSHTRYRAWLLRDPKRADEFAKAQQLGARAIEDDLIRISDGVNPDGSASIEDVTRSKLKIDTRKFVLRVIDIDRYGETKQVNATVVNVTEERARTMTTSEIKAMLVKRIAEDNPDILDVVDKSATNDDTIDPNTNDDIDSDT